MRNSIEKREFKSQDLEILKLVFSKKATQTDEILLHHQFDINLVKSTVKILSIFVAFLENMNFKMKIA